MLISEPVLFPATTCNNVVMNISYNQGQVLLKLVKSEKRLMVNNLVFLFLLSNIAELAATSNPLFISEP